MSDLVLYARVKNETDKVKETRLHPDGYPEAELSHKFGPSFNERWIPVVDLPDETFDPATHKLVLQETVTPTQVERQRVAVELTEREKKRKELKDKKDEIAGGIDAIIEKLKADDNLSKTETNSLFLYILDEIE